eukprot:33244-Pyramimonas_sp.AAC.1
MLFLAVVPSSQAHAQEGAFIAYSRPTANNLYGPGTGRPPEGADTEPVGVRLYLIVKLKLCLTNRGMIDEWRLSALGTWASL